MRRLLIIFAALLVIAAVEITVLILIAHAIGVGWTILAVLATSALGGWLLRREGPRAWRAFRAEVAGGRPPGNAATDGVLVFIGCVMMLVPGFVTAAIGALLLIPPVRRLGRALVLRIFGRRISPAAATSLFGPRRVRVRYGAPHHPDEQNNPTSGPAVGTRDRPDDQRRTDQGPRSGPPSGSSSGPGSGQGGSRPSGDEPIEGEIIDPR